jgi:hypothetical protein
MFEVGDKIVCINNGLEDYIFADKSYCLTMYKTYTVILKKSDTTISIMNDQNLQQPFSIYRFKLLSDFRKQKIEKICSKLGIK